MSDNYNYTTVATLKSSILIEIRNKHTAKIAEELVSTRIVSNEYLDTLIRIDMMKQLQIKLDLVFDDKQRIRKLIQLLQKYSIASTASFISNIYS